MGKWIDGMLTAVRVHSTVLSFFVNGRNVNWSLCSPQKHYVENRGTAPPILNLEDKWWTYSHGIYWIEGLLSPRAGRKALDKRKISNHYQDLNPRPSSPQPSSNTDCATLAPNPLFFDSIYNYNKGELNEKFTSLKKNLKPAACSCRHRTSLAWLRSTYCQWKTATLAIGEIDTHS